MEAVESVARRPLPPHPKLRHRQADLRASEARRAFAGVDVLYHLGFQLWRSAPAPEVHAANVDGTANVAGARPGRIVFASSAAVYGAWPRNPVPLDEDASPRPNPECGYASQKLAAERICADAPPAAVLRLPAVLGPGADRLARQAARAYRRLVPAAQGASQGLQFLHEDDAAAALLAAPDGMWNAAPHDWLDEQAIAALAGGRVVRLPGRSLVRVAEAAFRLGLSPVGADRPVFLTGPIVLDSNRLRVRIGWAPRSSANVLADFLRVVEDKKLG